LLFSGAVLGRPSTYAQRVARRAAGRGSLPNQRIEKVSTDSTNSSNVDYSSNWSGAVLTSPPSGQTFKTVVGTFNVPTATGGSSTSSSAWVGIDGDTYGNAILQAGVDFNGDGTYDSWYEWYPDYAYDFSGFSIESGDEITVTIVATTLAAGTVTLKNSRTGSSVSKSLSSSSHLGGQNAEWIVEDFEENGSLVPLSDFGTITFTNCTATTNTGTVLSPSDSGIIEIEQNGEVLTSVSVSGSTVTVKYV